MAPRLELQALLESLVVDEKGKVYFQPPPSIVMTYPAIVYSRGFALTNHADNIPYRHTKRYTVTIICKDPDSDIPDKVAALPMCSFNRFFTADGLNHDIYNLFF